MFVVPVSVVMFKCAASSLRGVRGLERKEENQYSSERGSITRLPLCILVETDNSQANCRAYARD